jgi:DNA-binding transcriptional regulator YiaG
VAKKAAQKWAVLLFGCGTIDQCIPKVATMVLTPEDIEAVATAVVNKFVSNDRLLRLMRDDLSRMSSQGTKASRIPTSPKEKSYQMRCAESDEARRKSQERRVLREKRYEECLQLKSAVSLRVARGKKDISQEQLAELTNIPFIDIRAFERGRLTPNHA